MVVDWHLGHFWGVPGLDMVMDRGTVMEGKGRVME
jgi:hypothetical protein